MAKNIRLAASMTNAASMTGVRLGFEASSATDGCLSARGSSVIDAFIWLIFAGHELINKIRQLI